MSAHLYSTGTHCTKFCPGLKTLHISYFPSMDYTPLRCIHRFKFLLGNKNSRHRYRYGKIVYPVLRHGFPGKVALLIPFLTRHLLCLFTTRLISSLSPVSPSNSFRNRTTVSVATVLQIFVTLLHKNRSSHWLSVKPLKRVKRVKM